jgi:luciferase family oxidoreductase group 1
MAAHSILDLCPIPEGGTAADAFAHAADLARHAEQWGYRRYWIAEHHNMPGIASAATSIVIAHVAAATKTIRVGSGGIMLPNHSPLVIAEQFGTLASLYPGRIDLGLGRAPGTDRATAHALRRNMSERSDDFPDDVLELQALFRPAQPGQHVRAVPGAGLDVPIWILGSSLFGAQLAAQLGLPYAFASHFAPAQLMQALRIYRANFRPSEQWPKPYTMAGLAVVAAESDREAQRLFSSLQQMALGIYRNRRTKLPPPVDDIHSVCTPDEFEGIGQMLSRAVVGSPQTAERGLRAFLADTEVDELILTANIFDHDARLRSFKIAAEASARI